MPLLQRPKHDRRRAALARGFTLIELLVVMVLIGVIASFSVMTLGDNRGQELEREARRLNAVIGLAAEESVLRGRQIGLHVDHDSYGFSYWEDGKWVRTEDDRHLRAHTLPEPMYLELVVEGFTVGGEGGKQKRDEPQVVLFFSGEMTPFDLTVNHPDLETYYSLEGQLDGKLALTSSE